MFNNDETGGTKFELSINQYKETYLVGFTGGRCHIREFQMGEPRFSETLPGDKRKGRVWKIAKTDSAFVVRCNGEPVLEIPFSDYGPRCPGEWADDDNLSINIMSTLTEANSITHWRYEDVHNDDTSDLESALELPDTWSKSVIGSELERQLESLHHNSLYNWQDDEDDDQSFYDMIKGVNNKNNNKNKGRHDELK